MNAYHMTLLWWHMLNPGNWLSLTDWLRFNLGWVNWLLSYIQAYLVVNLLIGGLLCKRSGGLPVLPTCDLANFE